MGSTEDCVPRTACIRLRPLRPQVPRVSPVASILGHDGRRHAGEDGMDGQEVPRKPMRANAVPMTDQGRSRDSVTIAPSGGCWERDEDEESGEEAIWRGGGDSEGGRGR